MQTTLLIYMAADNNLDNFAYKDLEQIKKSSINSDMNIVVQYDSNRFVDSPDTLRLYIQKGEVVKEEELGETNTGDPTVLKTFIDTATQFYPAERTLLIIWSHGAGIDDRNPYAEEKERERYFVPATEIEEIAVGYDDSQKDFLDNLELQKALSSSIEIDLLGFDSCLMGMFEILYQLRDQTKVMIASQHLEPASGWDYPRILGELNLSATVEDMGRALIAFHDEHNQGGFSRDVTQSALDATVAKEVANDLDNFALALREALKKGERKERIKDLKYTLKNAQYFNRKDYVDLVDFVHKVKNRLALEEVEPHANRLLQSLDKMIIANHTIGYFMEEANGVSIYFPNSSRPFKETFELYEKLDFATACPNWIKLLKWYWL